ncbi:MAG: FGGY-family carbohydrate kinase [Cyanobacteriota bacterium]|nr:FGGY-family carbohydrate kinase [Cyanobacteriota bacterium]
MPPEPLGLGVDLGSSGLRLALVCAGEPIWQTAAPYPGRFEDPTSWWQGLVALCRQIPDGLRPRVGAIAIDGTSGTLLLCRPDGSLLSGELAWALPYHQACLEQAGSASALANSGPNPNSAAAGNASGSLARALQLLEGASCLLPSAQAGPELLLRHQADWLMGQLLGHWRYGEATNNLRLGWLQGEQPGWAGAIGLQHWSGALPQVIECGTVAGRLHPSAAAALDLPPPAMVVAGCTDASAAVLAAAVGTGVGITVLGTTLALKQWSQQPIAAAGVSCQRLGQRWLVGGASNAGGGVLRRFFTDAQLAALSRQIDPERPSGLQLRPLPAVGERFPVDDPTLQPVLEPRPVSDARYLQGLLEGLAAIEAAGWQRLRQLGAPPVHQVISLGGGARNPQWRAIRARALGVPVLNRPQLSAALGMARLAADALQTPAHG